ncbi:IPRI protein, partial [Geococcyx californianus]|nr:IPRI protein [Geococcyx californianus]
TTEITFTPITMWSECYAVAEVKFFRHMAREAPYDTFHLRCLQVCAHILVNTSFSMYIFKTVVMHVLTITQLSGQCRRDCLLLLLDVMQYLCCCLAEKRLNHFFFGNENVPKELILPPDFQTAQPLNLFQPLIQDPHIHAKVQREFLVLRDRLRSVLIYGH